MKTSIAARNIMLDALAAQANSGKLRIYNGTEPATPETALSGNTLLAELTMNATAFGAASNGVITAAAITSDSAADATGTASFFRLFKSDGTTVLWQGTVGTSATDLIVGTVSFVANAIISVSALTVTAPQ